MFGGRSNHQAVAGLILAAVTLLAQPADEAMRVTVTMNPNGSKTVYRVDGTKHESVATTTSASGKPVGKIIYVAASSAGPGGMRVASPKNRS